MNPLELADYVVAGATLLVGLVVGRRMRPKPPEPLRPVCSCGHGYGTHEDGRRCFGRDEKRRNGVVHLDECPCRRYDGPDPLIFGIESAGGAR